MLNEVHPCKHGGEQQFSPHLLSKVTQSICTEMKPILQVKKVGGKAQGINNRVK